MKIVGKMWELVVADLSETIRAGIRDRYKYLYLAINTDCNTWNVVTRTAKMPRPDSLIFLFNNGSALSQTHDSSHWEEMRQILVDDELGPPTWIYKTEWTRPDPDIEEKKIDPLDRFIEIIS